MRPMPDNNKSHTMCSLVKRFAANTSIGSIVFVCFLFFLSLSNAHAQLSSSVCLYSEPNFQGRSFCSSTNTSLVPLNFSTASLKISKGYEVTVYRFPLFFGQSAVFSTDQADIRSQISNVSSLKLIEKPISDTPKVADIIPVIAMLLLNEPTEPVDPNDLDGDGFTNELENEYETDPTDPSSTPPDLDGDKIPDDIDNDRDGDGVNNQDEIDADTNPDDVNDFPDLVAPTLTIDQASSSRTTASSFVITGTAVDPVQAYSGIERVAAQNTQFSDSEFSSVIETDSGVFSIEVPLKIGNNSITVTLVDQSGNQSQETLQVERGDTPTIESILPSSNTVVSTEQVSISGAIRSTMQPDRFRVFFNDSEVLTQSTNQADLYQFSFDNVALNLGDNRFSLRVTSDFGSDQSIIVIRYTPDAAEELAAPSITNISPNSGQQLNQQSFRLGAQIESFAGTLTVSVNGSEVLSSQDGLSFYSVNEVLSFEDDQNSVSATISASDSLGKTTSETVTFYRDSIAPSISLDGGFIALDAINTVDTGLVNITGTVSDENLSSFLINNQSIELSAGSDDQSYTFNYQLPVGGEQPSMLDLLAYDRSGNKREITYAFLNNSSATVSALLPPNDSEFISRNNLAISLQVAARITGLNDGDRVIAFTSGNRAQASVLTLTGTLASGDLNLPADVLNQTITFEAQNAQGQRLSNDSISVSVQAESAVELELVRIEPSNNQQNIEPNQPIEIYFNKPIDPTKLDIKLFETLHGKSYVNADPLGEDFISAKGYVLSDLNRERELVAGQINVIPGEAGVVFVPSANYGYNAELFIDVEYDGENLSRTRTKVRELPTFINGSISDQFGQPLAGIKVELPELNRQTTTNGDGGFAFGYQEAADKLINSGTYRLVVNNEFANTSFGVINTDISVQRNRINPLPRYVLQELDPSIAFSSFSSSSNNVLLGGDLTIDLSNASARALFPNSRTSGPVLAQFLAYEHLGVQTYPFALPTWAFGLQPKGIEIEGDVQLSFTIPKLRGSRDYIDPLVFTHVVLLGYANNSQVFEPIGVGEIRGTQVHSVGELNISTLDYLGYAQVLPQLNDAMASYAAGTISLQQLKAELQNAAQAQSAQFGTN